MNARRLGRRGAGLPVAVLLGAAVALLPAVPAQAAGCAPGKGVTVVVEFGDLGGGTSVSCDGNGGGSSARTATERVGFDLDFVASQPAFVCRVDGKPASDPCQRTPPSNAYWGLFWSDGDGGWKYSGTSASGLKVPAGGSIGWRWQDGGATDYPAAAPNKGSAPEPAPEPKPDPRPGRDEKPRGGGGSGDGGRQDGGQEAAPDEPTPSASPSPDGSAGGDRPEKGRDEKSRDKGKRDRGDRKGDRRPDATASATPSDSPETDPTEDVTEGLAPVSDDADGSGGGSDPTMLLVAGGAVLVLGAAAGVTAWRRRS